MSSALQQHIYDVRTPFKVRGRLKVWLVIAKHGCADLIDFLHWYEHPGVKICPYLVPQLGNSLGNEAILCGCGFDIWV